MLTIALHRFRCRIAHTVSSHVIPSCEYLILAPFYSVGPFLLSSHKMRNFQTCSDPAWRKPKVLPIVPSDALLSPPHSRFIVVETTTDVRASSFLQNALRIALHAIGFSHGCSDTLDYHTLSYHVISSGHIHSYTTHRMSSQDLPHICMFYYYHARRTHRAAWIILASTYLESMRHRLLRRREPRKFCATVLTMAVGHTRPTGPMVIRPP